MKTFDELCKLSKDLYFEPFVIKEFITPEEHEFCLKTFDESVQFDPATHGKAIRKDSQMHADFGPSRFKDIFLPKLDSMFETKSTCVGSNFTQWNSPVPIHTDGYQLPYVSVGETEQNEEILGFAVIVPLRTDTGKGNPTTVMFNQTLYGGGGNFGGPAHPKDSEKITDLGLIEQYTNKAFDKTDPNYHYIDHLSDERLHGFSIDRVFNWNMRDAIVWHRSQFHCSSKFVGFNNKTHLVFLCNFKMGET